MLLLTLSSEPASEGLPAEIEKVQALGLEKAVDQLVEATPDHDPPPAWADLRVQNDLRTQIQQTLTHESPQSGRKLQSEQFRNETNDLTFWWITSHGQHGFSFP